MKIAREYNALTRIPEEMPVGELNQAVKDLREMLYQSRLKIQSLEKEMHRRGEEEMSNPEEDPRVLICFDCGTKEKVRETTCPFASEINNEEIEVNLCDDCYRERMYDI